MFGLRHGPNSTRAILPAKACQCGSSAKSTFCLLGGLRNHVNFPLLCNMPDLKGIHGGYENIEDITSEGRVVASRSRHWTFVGQVDCVGDQGKHVIERVSTLQDESNIEVRIERSSFPLPWKDVEVGHTIVVMYPEVQVSRDEFHPFRTMDTDESKSVIIANPHHTMVFPTDMYSLERAFLHMQSPPQSCFVCRKKEVDDASKCDKCRRRWCCSNEDCHNILRDHHEKMCLHMPILAPLAKLDFRTYDEAFRWLTTISDAVDNNDAYEESWFRQFVAHHNETAVRLFHEELRMEMMFEEMFRMHLMSAVLDTMGDYYEPSHHHRAGRRGRNSHQWNHRAMTAQQQEQRSSNQLERSEAPAAADAGNRIECHACHEMKAVHAFSKTQRRKHTKRRCEQCILHHVAA
mmetsp:Transcript_8660/g.24890  ORF Transcript_8660/g.24890 Transcript_8660/m.24890 type:complete len:405 (-) Transcript_8660:222-1436(-)